jgi:hypothetical protein
MTKPKSQSRQSDRRISTEWFHGLDPSEHAAFEQAWRNSTYVMDKLRGIVERRIASLETDKEDDYNNPMWPVLRADRNGQLRQLKDFLKLLP